MAVKINSVGTCNYDVGTGVEHDDRVVFCGATAVCELWFPDDPLPEARFCKQHRPELKELG